MNGLIRSGPRRGATTLAMPGSGISKSLAATAILASMAMSSASSGAQVAPGKFDITPSFAAQNIRSEEMGRCAVRHDRRHAAALATSAVGSDGEHAALSNLMPALTKCLAGARSATLDPSYMRGGVAEALLHDDDDLLLKQAASMTAVPPVRVTLLHAREPNVVLMTCAAAAQPGDAAAMLREPAGSPSEAAAFRKLTPSLEACVPAEGETHLAPARIRPAIAIALYRLETAR